MTAAQAVVRSWIDAAPVPMAGAGHGCAALDWAASGGMALTGAADGPPDLSPAAAFGLLRVATELLTALTTELGAPVAADPAEIVAGRAAWLGLHRAGRRSAGGASRLLRTADGWCALTLSRAVDIDTLPAVFDRPVAGDPWDVAAEVARRSRAAELADRAQLVGIPAAALPTEITAALPWTAERIAGPRSTRALRGRMVVDLSTMWAGPLCARLLGLAGARVVKVEATDRPDGARAGDPRFFHWLHAGHEQRRIDFRTAGGRAELRALIDSADIVLEASRPRALAQLGLDPTALSHPDGRIWLSLTGYGRAEPMRVAFGDDAAVAGGLVGAQAGEPVFCADAIADPLSGVCAALAVVAAAGRGGGELIDLSMRGTAAAFAAAPALDHGPHPLRRIGDRWQVHCPRAHRSQPVRAPRPPTRVVSC
jgi:hypothetical protein